MAKSKPKIMLSMSTTPHGQPSRAFVVWLENGRAYLGITKQTGKAVGRGALIPTRNPRLDMPEGFTPKIVQSTDASGSACMWNEAGECYRFNYRRRSGGVTRDETMDFNFEAADKEFRDQAAAAYEKKAEAHEAAAKKAAAQEADKKRQAEKDAEVRKKAEAERERLKKIAEKTRKGELDDNHYLDDM